VASEPGKAWLGYCPGQSGAGGGDVEGCVGRASLLTFNLEVSE
jgi:hypothetical protein